MQQKCFSPELKTKIVLEVLKEQETVAQIASRFEVDPKRIYAWKKEFLEKAASVFETPSTKKDSDKETDLLYRQIGKLQVEVDWLKKKSAILQSR